MESKMIQDMQQILGNLVEKIVTGIMKRATKSGKVFYHKELEAIAKRSGMDVGRIAFLNLSYEASAHCTSFIIKKGDGTPIHLRTMDWDMTELRELTIELDFQRKGRTVFLATSWAGYLGILTGCVPNGYSISVNFRITEDGSFWQNIKRAMGKCWPIGFLIREICTTTNDYKTAVEFLATSHLIAPVYLTVCGKNKDEGCLITRNPGTEELNRVTLDENTLYTIQTNIDHWSNDTEMDVMSSIHRRKLFKQRHQKLLDDRKEINPTNGWKIFEKNPLINEITIYGTYMSPKDGILQTRVPLNEKFSPTIFKKEMAGVVFINEEHVEDDNQIVEIKTIKPPGLPTCSVCKRHYYKENNKKGHCLHTGKWHDKYSDCGIGCVFKIKFNIGSQHWGCGSLKNSSTSCVNSPKHKIN
eukprot:TRINITY_DN3448_c0_g1_i1.p1 TRINITY_DN3448_c0_g1~~TRINITY_DN3448_c0_g1_i1.p1  ORF type:complete len:481 (-),score=111.33 TRINITY_DN3448_c0_g1_i1:8-1249(-)